VQIDYVLGPYRRAEDLTQYEEGLRKRGPHEMTSQPACPARQQKNWNFRPLPEMRSLVRPLVAVDWKQQSPSNVAQKRMYVCYGLRGAGKYPNWAASRKCSTEARLA
jgi:hypothetical protein